MSNSANDSHDIGVIGGTRGDAGLPDGYREHLINRKNAAASDTELPLLADLLQGSADNSHGVLASYTDAERKRPKVALLAVAAAVTLVAVGLVAALGARGVDSKVQAAGPGQTSGDPGPVVPAEPTPATSVPSDPLAGLPLLFPPGPADQVQARLGPDPEIQDPDVIAGSFETFVAGEVGEAAKVITVASGPRSGTYRDFGLGIPPDMTDWLYSPELQGVEPLRENLKKRAEESSVDDWVSFDVEDLGDQYGFNAMKVASKKVAGNQLFILVRSKSWVAILVGNVEEDVLRQVLASLVIQGDHLRVSAVPPGFSSLGLQRDGAVVSPTYSVLGPPLDSSALSRIPTSVYVTPNQLAGLRIALHTIPPSGQGAPVILRKSPALVLGNPESYIVMGFRGDAWVTAGEFTIRARDENSEVDANSKLLELWDGLGEVDRTTFDAALGRGSGSNNAFDGGRTAKTTTIVGG